VMINDRTLNNTQKKKKWCKSYDNHLYNRCFKQLFCDH
jgi:hypothetical protein